MFSRDIILILTASFFYMSSPMLVTPLITGFAGSLGASAALMGMTGGLMYLCSLFCRPFVGNLSDKISKYKLSLIGAGLMTLSCLGYIVAPNPVFIIAARIVNGIGFACCSVCMTTWMSNLLPRDRIGSGMGFYGIMNALGMAISPGLGVFIYQVFGYRPAFMIAMGFAVLTVLIIHFISDRGEPVTSTKADQKREKLQIIDKNVAPIALIIMLFAIPYFMTQAFLVKYVETRGLNVNVTLFFPAYAIILIVLRFILKESFDRLPFQTFLFTGALCSTASIICLTFMNSNIILLTAAAFMAGSYGIMCSVSQSTAILLAGEGKRGLANSTYYIGLDLGMSLGPVLGGFLYGHLDLPFFFPVMLLTVPLVLAVYFMNRKKLEKHLH